jgi:BMFP domain-containing protein YqiC
MKQMTFRDDPAAYMRAYRARKKAGKAASAPKPRRTSKVAPIGRIAEPLIDADALPHGALAKLSNETAAYLRAKIAAIGPGAVITKTNERLDVITRAEADARTPALLTPPSPDLIRKSMAAIGGRPGRGLIPQARGYAAPPDLAAVSPYTRAEEFETRTMTMLAAQAAKIDELERRVAPLEQARRREHEAADRAAPWLNLISLAMTLSEYACRNGERQAASTKRRAPINPPDAGY